MTASAQARTLPLFASDKAGASFSADRRYRYHLWRAWGDIQRRCVFVGLNPSDADETEDDQTIKKCIGFARRWGFGAIDMVNLFAQVSTDPRGLGSAPMTAVGDANDRALEEVFTRAAAPPGAARRLDTGRIVWCWGEPPGRSLRAYTLARAATVRAIADRLMSPPTELDLEAGHLGLTASGAPRHPSRIGYATRFQAET